MKGTRRQILEYLRRCQRSTVADLASVTGVAEVTVRHHMGVLREQALVESTAEPMGRGRPRLVYRLSPAGAASLEPGRAIEVLAGDLLGGLRAGPCGSLSELLEHVAASAVGDASDTLEEEPTAARLDAAVGLLRSRGFAASWEADERAYRLRVEGCPYERLGGARGQLCALDLSILRRMVSAGFARERGRRESGAGCCFHLAIR